VRRAGKTYILYELVKKHGGTYINFEDERLADFTVADLDKLYSIALEEKSEFLFLDEVQNIRGWERFASRVQKKIKLFVSGSNSGFLSSEFSSSLTGRTMTFRVYPLSFREFLSFTDSMAKTKDELRTELEHYLDLGGFPRIVATAEKRLAQEYFDRIIYRDVIPRFRIKKPEAIHRLALYLLSNVGMRFSYRRLKEYCGLKHESTVKEYVNYLKQAFLLDSMNKFDPSLKNQEASPKKAYAVDTVFPSVVSSVRPDKTRLFENVVFNELIRLEEGRTVYYADKKGEIDFLVCSGTKPAIGMNVAYEINNQKTLEREVQPLNSLRTGIRRILLTLYPPPTDVPKGVEYADATDFFMGKFAL
jgi:predicted AAA+ superfamily ATPase